MEPTTTAISQYSWDALKKMLPWHTFLHRPLTLTSNHCGAMVMTNTHTQTSLGQRSAGSKDREGENKRMERGTQLITLPSPLTQSIMK